MALATITSKGQVTIPKQVRESLRLHTGDRIDFIVTDEGDVILKPVTKRVDDVFGRLHRPGCRSVSVEQMDAAIGQRIREDFT